MKSGSLGGVLKHLDRRDHVPHLEGLEQHAPHLQRLHLHGGGCIDLVGGHGHGHLCIDGEAGVAHLLQQVLPAHVVGGAELLPPFGNGFADFANIRAQLANAKWELEQTTVLAPADGYPTNVQLRPGSFTTAFPITPAMTFVEEKYQVVALFHQNELQLVEEGNEAEFTLKAHPGRIIKASVESIVWAQGQGQVANSTQLPMTGVGPMPPGRFPVRLTISERDADLFLPAGAIGLAASDRSLTFWPSLS